MKNLLFSFLFIGVFLSLSAQQLVINSDEYFEMPGLNVMVFYDIYPEGHQGAIGIIQNGTRVATNGDLRLEPTPGQWQPIPKTEKRQVFPENNEIRVKCTYPDESRNRKGFNPVFYPDLNFSYNVRVIGEGKNFRMHVASIHARGKLLRCGQDSGDGFLIVLKLAKILLANLAIVRSHPHTVIRVFALAILVHQIPH